MLYLLTGVVVCFYMIKLIAFDVDGTIASHDGVVYDYAMKNIKKYDEMGIKLAFISGKPSGYLSGFVRNLGVSDAVLGGEGGTSLYFNLHYPIRKEIEFEFDKSKLVDFKCAVLNKYKNDINLQPNVVTLCMFLKDRTHLEDILKMVDIFIQENPDFTYLVHREPAIEIFPKKANKLFAIESIQREFGIMPSEMIAMGDGENDIPMFAGVEHSVGIGRKEAKYVVENPENGFRLISKLIEEEINK